ncbi:hypothetical protein CPB83DRAFT_850950 [Crepidotus variabilis]|uniref:ZW10 C-terminal helical domain-containing protein n=1 Tax=Crepidotus variabilis TaxID=179855 RepID=A0A9P6EKV3_9AGAR|nr:hypothetical protein CPB83DRAFT_850950 [Crepidotus variabilis]
MAFPVPDHLPKRSIAVDISSQILYKIDEATRDTLNASLASGWIRELDESIEATKYRVHERIQSEVPKFRQQLETSRSVHTRYGTLTSRVDELKDALSNPENGILTNLICSLTTHSRLAQDAMDTAAIFEAFSSLLLCKNAYVSLASLAQAGHLPEAVKATANVENLLQEMPCFLAQTPVADDLKNKFTATRTRVQDQLGDAYSRSIMVSPTAILIRPFVQVRGSQTTLQLKELLCSVAPSSLAHHLTILRRDLLAFFVDHVLKQPYSIDAQSSSPDESKLSLIPAPPNEDAGKRLQNLSSVLAFLADHLFSNLPTQEATQFTRSIAKPVATSVLTNLLMPTLPSSFGLLPSFLVLLKQAVKFEEKDIGRLLDSAINEGSIKAWSDGISGHYERRRRIEILESTRKEIIAPEGQSETFQAFTEGSPETSLPSVVPVQEDEDVHSGEAWGLDEPPSAALLEGSPNGRSFDDNVFTTDTSEGDAAIAAESWDLDEPSTPTTPNIPEADSWGLDEDIDSIPDPEPEVLGEQQAPNTNSNMQSESDDAWGWNDEPVHAPADDGAENDNWDDPWADSIDGGPSAPAPAPASPLLSPASVVSLKAATRLEKKFASKSKKQLNGHSASSSLSSPSVSEPAGPSFSLSTPSPPPQASTEDHQATIRGRRQSTLKRPAAVLTTIAPKEHYLVPKRTKRVIKIVEKVIDESKLFYASNLFPESKDMVPAPGSILSQSASSILDLYQVLYPTKHTKELEDPVRGLLFSNSCLYMSGAIHRIEDTLYGHSALKDRLSECRRHLQVLSDSWYSNTIERQQLAIDKILADGAEGFAYTGDQDRYDDCEAAVNSVLQHIKKLANRLKGILTKTKYYNAIGSVANAALSRVLQDVLALPDIPEVESHRLSELCRILNSLEGLFSEDPDQPSFVAAYVPNWFKFSYLSELLEASLADITYLFEQGALVDFQVGELVNLVRALFADTQLRINTINKILAGHPTPSH